MKSNEKGFTLIEIVIVLIILALLAAIAIPTMVGYISQAKKTAAISECQTVVQSAQKFYVESYATGEAVTVEQIKELAEVTGDITGIETYQGTIIHLTYIKDTWTVVYCNKPETCDDHTDTYNVSKTSQAGDPAETSPTPTPTSAVVSTADYFYIDNDIVYKVNTLGDLATYDFGPYGSTITEGSVFYWQSEYYYTRNNQYLTNTSDKQQYINTYTVNIDIANFKTPGISTAPGDLKLENGNVYIFFPYARYSEDYKDSNYWFPVQIS